MISYSILGPQNVNHMRPASIGTENAERLLDINYLQ